MQEQLLFIVLLIAWVKDEGGGGGGVHRLEVISYVFRLA